MTAASSHGETDSPAALRWIEAEGKRREAAAIERFADDVENMLRAEVRARRNDLVDVLAARGVDVDVREVDFALPPSHGETVAMLADAGRGLRGHYSWAAHDAALDRLVRVANLFVTADQPGLLGQQRERAVDQLVEAVEFWSLEQDLKPGCPDWIVRVIEAL